MQEYEEVAKMDQVERLMQRPLLYNNIDGVGELGLGCMFLGSALLQWLPIRDIWWHRYGSFVGFLLLITAIHYGIQSIKTSITFPRTGFVAYRKRETVWRPMILGAGVSALIAAGLYFVTRSYWDIDGSHWAMTMPAILLGLVFAAGYAYGIARAVRWKLGVAAAMAICSVEIVMLPMGAIRAMTGNTSAAVTAHEWIFGALLLTFVINGVFLLISGSVSLVLYLRHTQPAAETAE
jgi:hypothetical protein